MFYLRYTTTPDKDMDFGYSIHQSSFQVGQPATWNDEDERSEEEIVAESLGCEPDEVVVVGGLYCQQLAGLCAFDLNADTLEEAIEVAREHNYNDVYNFDTMGDAAVIFEGDYAGDCPEGDLMTPIRIAHVF